MSCSRRIAVLVYIAGKHHVSVCCRRKTAPACQFVKAIAQHIYIMTDEWEHVTDRYQKAFIRTVPVCCDAPCKRLSVGKNWLLQREWIQVHLARLPRCKFLLLLAVILMPAGRSCSKVKPQKANCRCWFGSPDIACNTRAGAITAQDLPCIAWADNLNGASHSGVLAGNGEVKHHKVHSKHSADWLRRVDCT